MKRIIHIALATALGITMQDACSGLVVIVNPLNHNQMNLEQIRNIFLGKTRSFPDGSTAIPVEISNQSSLRKDFEKVVLKKDDAQVRAYWAQMVFTGRATPPKTISSEAELRTLIASNPNLVGYIDSGSADNSVKVVLQP